MRLGGPVDGYSTPSEWISRVKKLGYTAVYFPLSHDAPTDEIDAYAEAARQNDIVIAEVGAWSNPISTDNVKAAEAMELCKARLELAERVGAHCCVNISGSLSEKWDGPHPDNMTGDTFALIVDVVRDIIDVVNPKRTFYTLEMMPWAFPYNADTYLELIHAVDRKGFAVHLDPVNIITSPMSYFNNTYILRDCFVKLAPHIKSCHAKDIRLEDDFTVHLNETRPGLGNLDYKMYLSCLKKLDDVPLMLEHLSSQEEYALAAEYVRSVNTED